MSAHNRDHHDIRRKGAAADNPPLPPWIARKHLAEKEDVTWVHGPACGTCERVLTNILLFATALVLALSLIIYGGAVAGRVADIHVLIWLTAIGLIIGSILVLALANGYYTRLVVTNRHVMILQGNEQVRRWRIDSLPRSLTKYNPSAEDDDPEASRRVDLDALKSLFDNTGKRSSTSQGIMAIGKQVDNLRARERDDD